MDIPTLLIVLATVLSLTSIALAMTWRLNQEVPGLPQWTMGHITISIGILLMVTQNQWHPLISVVLANLLIGTGYALSVAGTRAFFGRDPALLWRLAPVVLAIAAGLAWFSIVAPSLPERIVLASSLYAVLFAMAVREFLCHGGLAKITSGHMAVVFSLFAVVTVARVATTLLFPASGSLFNGGFMEQVTFYNGIVQGILIALGYIILTTERLQQELREQAALDPLTGIFNRRAFFEAASGRIAEAVRARQPLSVLAVDLDHFKRINDGFGHAVGDRVLRQFVCTARRELRQQDTLARFGGEEFVALLPRVGVAEAEGVAQRLARRFADAPLRLDGRPVEATVSVGVAELDAGLERLEGLLKRADDALYRAKSRGRNQVQRAVPPEAAEGRREAVA